MRKPAALDWSDPGAIPTIGIALLHSTTAGVGMAIVYFVYQQLGNNVLSVVIMSKTIHINQLLAMISILGAAELFGVVGALLGLPAKSSPVTRRACTTSRAP